MPVPLLVVFVVVSGAVLGAQEREVPRDSVRISIPGCVDGRSFTVVLRTEEERGRSDVEEGRRFRLSGRKETLDAIERREGMMLEVTGLVRKAQLSGNAPGGISIFGGRVRIGGALPRDPIYGDPRRDPGYNQVVLDVESWRPLADNCPSR